MISKLQHKLNSATVIRDGKQINIPFSEIAFGELVVLREGMEIPADGLLIEGYDILVDESGMTGESDQISKNTYPYCQNLYRSKKNDHVQLGDHDIPSPLLLAGNKKQKNI